MWRAAVIVLALAACTPDEEAECIKRGGEMVGTFSGPACAMPAPDAGQACTTSSQCAGLCLADGQCSASDLNPGCTSILEDGEAVVICID